MTEPVAQKILVIDDDAETRRLMAACLDRYGCETRLVEPVRQFKQMAHFGMAGESHD
jgi:DNA-binding NtrC family response regulator